MLPFQANSLVFLMVLETYGVKIAIIQKEKLGFMIKKENCFIRMSAKHYVLSSNHFHAWTNKPKNKIQHEIRKSVMENITTSVQT